MNSTGWATTSHTRFTPGINGVTLDQIRATARQPIA